MWRIGPNIVVHYVSLGQNEMGQISRAQESHLKRDKSQVREKEREKVIPA